MTQFSLANLRFILDTEDQNDKPNSEELMQQLRENLEALFMLLLDTGQSGSATSDPPNDTTGVLTDTGAAYDVDEHNGRTLLITSGIAKNMIFTIDDTTATTIICTDDNLYAAGVRSGDTYKILYDVKVNADGHDHDGVSSKTLGASSIDQAMLKSAIGQVSRTGSGNLTLPGGEYGFYPRVFVGIGDDYDYQIGVGITSINTITNIYLKQNSGTGYALQRYIQASGEVFWIFILRDKVTSNIISTWSAPDHPCFGCGGKPVLMPHPFQSLYDSAKHEILCINPGSLQLKNIYMAMDIEDENLPNRSFLEVLLQDWEIIDIGKAEWPIEPVTVALKEGWHEAYLEQRPHEIVKKVIPKPSNVATARIRPKVTKP